MPPVIEEAGERAPAFETVVDGLACLAVFGDPGALLAQPPPQFDDKRPAALIAHAHALLWRHAIDLALNGEQHIDAFDCLDGDRRLVDLCQLRRAWAQQAASTIGPGLRLAS